MEHQDIIFGERLNVVRHAVPYFNRLTAEGFELSAQPLPRAAVRPTSSATSSSSSSSSAAALPPAEGDASPSIANDDHSNDAEPSTLLLLSLDHYVTVLPSSTSPQELTMEQRPTLIINFDGASTRNSGCSGGVGVAVYNTTTTETPQLVVKLSQYLGDNKTNNQAEYAALLASIRIAIRLQAAHVTLVSDSKLLVDQMYNRCVTSDEVLGSLRLSCQSLLATEFGKDRWTL